MKTEIPPTRSAGTFIWVAMAATSGGLGLMLASLAALRCNEQGFYFVWNLWVLLAFLIGAGLGVSYWLTAMKLGELEAVNPVHARKKKQTFKLVAALLAFVSIFAFLYPMKFVKPEKRDDVRGGLLMVPFFVIPALTGWYVVKRFLEKEEAETARRDLAGGSPK
jgi:MFS family permease